MDYIGLSDLEIQRRESLKELRNLGIDPYPAAEYHVDIYSTDILETFSDENMPENLKSVSLAGRIMSRRIMGNASLLNYKIVKEEYSFILNVMMFALVKINNV